MSESERVAAALNARADAMKTAPAIPIDMGDRTPMVEALALDGWYNQLTGAAIYNDDKRESTRVTYTRKTYEALSAIYQSSWLAARVVDKPIDEMLREGFKVVVANDSDGVAQDTEEAIEDLQWEHHFREALKWQAIYGGSCIFMGINDGKADLSEPVDEGSIKSIDYLNAFDASEARVIAWQENPALPDYGFPVYFRIIPTIIGNEVTVPREAVRVPDSPMPTGVPAPGQQIVNNIFIPAMQKIHASRILWFPGERISRRANLWQNTPGAQPRWGDSYLMRIVKLIRDFEGSWDGVAYNLQEFEQAIFKIQGLAAALASDKQGFVQKRWHSIQLSRSMIKAVMLDKDGEEYERKSSTMSGVAETLREFAVIIAAAADMPVSVLLGSQDGGLGASGSGQNDIQNWYAAVRTAQNKRILPNLKRFIHMLLLSTNGPTSGDEPDHWKIQFNPLTQLSDTEAGALYYQIAQADQIYFTMGAIGNRDIANARFTGRPLTAQMTIDMDDLETREKMATELDKVTHKATVKNLKTGGSPEPLPPAPAAKPKPGGK